MTSFARLLAVGATAAAAATTYSTMRGQANADRLASAATFGFFATVAAKTGASPVGVIAPASLGAGYLLAAAISPVVDAIRGSEQVSAEERTIKVDRRDGPVTVEITNDAPEPGTSSAPVEVEIEADTRPEAGKPDIAVDIEVDEDAGPDEDAPAATDGDGPVAEAIGRLARLRQAPPVAAAPDGSLARGAPRISLPALSPPAPLPIDRGLGDPALPSLATAVAAARAGEP